MLFELPDGTKRLFKSSDSYHFSREDSKTIPNAWELTEKYRYLFKWYKEQYDTSTNTSTPVKPVTPTPTDPEITVTFTKFLNEHEMLDFAYHCPDNIGSFDISDGACKKCGNFVSEDEVKKALSKSLIDSGWTIHKVAMGTKHGVDIEATQGQDRLLIEAKGEGTLNPMRVNNFLMVLGGLLQKMDSPDKQYGIALPAHQQYVKLIHKLPLYQKQQFKLRVFLAKRINEQKYAVGYYSYLSEPSV